MADRRAILLDLDGVLVETEPLKARAHVAAVARYGGSASEAVYRDVMGQSLEAVSRAFILHARIDVPLRPYMEAFQDEYQTLLSAGVRPASGAAALLARLDSGGWQRAVITSSDRETLRTVLAGAGLAPFDVAICAEDVARHKPAPDPYVAGLIALGCPATRAVAIEDTAAGVESASAAGIPVVAVRHAFNVKQDLSRAAASFDSLVDARAVLAALDRLTGRF